MKPISIEDPNTKNKDYGGFTYGIDFIPPTDKQIEGFENNLTKELAGHLLERLKKEVPEIISYPDFYGEAEDYLRQTNQSWTLRKEVALQIYKEFLHNLEVAISWDETEKCFYMNEKFITSFNIGDYYSPAYEIVPKIIKRWVEEGNNTKKKVKP